MKNIFWILALAAPCFGAARVQEEDKLAVNIINQNHNHNNHKIDVHPEKQDPSDCIKYCGDELKMRMADLSKQDLSKNFIKFSPNKRINFLRSLTPYEAQHFLTTLDDHERTVLKTALGDEGATIVHMLQCTVNDAKKQQKRETTQIILTTFLNIFLFGLRR